ncbi:hypothetical protein DB30_08057 [Enhygromyxa salina]|uniref:Uncharacterized protein n=1 Tax=Enhygromyxa salina TaxID=215803 RepID=A0A0C2CV17_9BACT|nr:hypothetical protein DB30_08057 [Enhygromyxa salina]
MLLAQRRHARDEVIPHASHYRRHPSFWPAPSRARGLSPSPTRPPLARVRPAPTDHRPRQSPDTLPANPRMFVSERATRSRGPHTRPGSKRAARSTSSTHKPAEAPNPPYLRTWR